MKNLKMYMEKNGISEEELAEEADVAVSVIEQLIRGEDGGIGYVEQLRLERAIMRRKKDEFYPNCVREEAVYQSEKGAYTVEDYRALPDDVRAELIDGKFFVMDAPSLAHQAMLSQLYLRIANYIAQNKGECMVFVPQTDVRLDADDKTVVQPDLLVVCNPEQLRAQAVVGAPDLVIEILSPSTRRKDMTLKRKKYRNAGVREYWIIDIRKKRVLVYCFEKGEMPVIYGFEDKVPVRIFGDRLKVDFKEIYSIVAKVPVESEDLD